MTIYGVYDYWAWEFDTLIAVYTTLAEAEKHKAVHDVELSKWGNDGTRQCYISEIELLEVYDDNL